MIKICFKYYLRYVENNYSTNTFYINYKCGNFV